jgi:hypothetical protein
VLMLLATSATDTADSNSRLEPSGSVTNSIFPFLILSV